MTTENISDSEIPPAKARRALSSDNCFLCGPFDVALDMLCVPWAGLRTCFAGDILNLGLRRGHAHNASRESIRAEFLGRRLEHENDSARLS
jgi:hypothetical protein